jgi:hypothetical protein
VSADIFLDRIERGIVVATNNADDFDLGTIFTELVRMRVEFGSEFSHRTETQLMSTPINLRVVEAIIFRKPVEIIPRGWSVGLRLDGFGMKEVSEALEGKGKGEFVHLRAQSSRSGE